MDTEKVCEQSKKVTFIHAGLKDLVQRLHELDKDWDPEFDEYLREEHYMGRTAREFIQDMRSAVNDLRVITAKLQYDHINLCLDLERVGRGESFSV